jgi:hypothetical protein
MRVETLGEVTGTVADVEVPLGDPTPPRGLVGRLRRTTSATTTASDVTLAKRKKRYR